LLIDDLARRPPRFVHHLAIYFDRLASSFARELERGGADASSTLRDQYLRARTRSMAAFFALHGERAYLADYARRVAASALSKEDSDAAASALPLETLEHLGKTARAGARELTLAGKVALAALALTPEATRQSGVDTNLAKQLARRAESIRATAIDEALSSVLDALTEARVRDDAASRYATLFQRVRQIWSWSGGDEAVERFAVDEVTGVAWIIYRKAKWQELRAVLAPCIELYESLAARIEADPKRHLAYSSKCAQVFVFRSDCESDKAKEWAYAERSIQLCSTHRNGRLSVAHLLCNRAIARLEATWFPSHVEVEAARSEIARAEELFPQSSRIGPAKQKLQQVLDKMGGGSIR